MKVRRKRKPAPVVLVAEGPEEILEGVRFVEVPTAELVVVDEVDLSGKYTDVGMFRDRFVKVAPRIAAADRDAFDGSAIVATIRAAGARAVLLAPVIVPEVRRVAPEKVARRTPREAVAAWFGEQKAIPAADRDAALELVLEFMDTEGM